MSMSSPINVLIFPCGAENAVEIHQALAHSIHVNLFGASGVDDHGRHVFENYCGDLPRINEANFDQAFTELLNAWRIQVVFATHDTVQAYLAPRAEVMGITLINGDPHTAATARRKSLTYELLADQPWTPTVYLTPADVEHWPVVIKPDLGQGGQSVCVAQDATEAESALRLVDQPLLVEYLPGEEITVDCFSDFQRELVWVGPRTRERVRAGISMRCHYLPDDPQIRRIAEHINMSLVLRGPWFFQLKKDRQGQWKLLEISCRVAGSMVAQRARGVNLPLMAIHDVMHRKVGALPQNNVSLIERRILTVMQLDYTYDTVYIDFDETLIMHGKAIPSALHFLYRMQARGKQLVLITRHAGNLEQAMTHARIAPNLFDRIIHIRDASKKSAYIEGNAIFIDNHFPERLDVARHCDIPVFDVDALELFN
ncbi:carbamoyl phosphate synthase-like protein [compost metagenome]